MVEHSHQNPQDCEKEPSTILSYSIYVAEQVDARNNNREQRHGSYGRIS